MMLSWQARAVPHDKLVIHMEKDPASPDLTEGRTMDAPVAGRRGRVVALPVTEKLSKSLLDLAEQFRNRPMRLFDVLQATRGRGYDLVLLLLVLPFMTPVTLPFLSTPFGMAVTLIGLRLALGQKPRLPRKLLMKELPARFVPRLLRAASRVLRLLEKFIKPRLAFMREGFVFQRVTGVLLAGSGLLLLLPLPIPFTNFMPACTIFLLAAGALERDGVFLIGGWIMFGLTVAFFALLAFGGSQAVEGIARVFSGSN